MRKGSRLARYIVILIVLIVALMLSGFGYGAWSDTVYIGNILKTGTLGITLSNLYYPHPPLSCPEPNGNVLQISVTGADAPGDYYCIFTINNNGTVPVKIDINPDSPFLPVEGVIVTVTDPFEGSLEGYQVDPGIPRDALVHISLAEGANTTFSFDITFNFVPWNH